MKLQLLTWSQHCAGDAASDTTAACCYEAQTARRLELVVASPARTRRWAGWPCSSPAVGAAEGPLPWASQLPRHRQTATAWRTTAVAERGVPVPKP